MLRIDWVSTRETICGRRQPTIPVAAHATATMKIALARLKILIVAVPPIDWNDPRRGMKRSTSGTICPSAPTPPAISTLPSGSTLTIWVYASRGSIA
jgi:hypothetical protein